jgi:hypothetical protein
MTNSQMTKLEMIGYWGLVIDELIANWDLEFDHSNSERVRDLTFENFYAILLLVLRISYLVVSIHFSRNYEIRNTSYEIRVTIY